jgi:hypothetical protein
MKTFIPATAAAVLLAAGVASGSAMAFPPPHAPAAGVTPAAYGPQAGPQRHMPPHARPGMHRPASLEQRAERMKERLKITDAQKPQWDALVGVMQKQAKAFASARAEFWQRKANGETPKTLTTPERMAARDQALQTRLDNRREFTTAFAALYNTMSPDQKKIADDLLSGRHHRR